MPKWIWDTEHRTKINLNMVSSLVIWRDTESGYDNCSVTAYIMAGASFIPYTVYKGSHGDCEYFINSLTEEQ